MLDIITQRVFLFIFVGAGKDQAEIWVGVISDSKQYHCNNLLYKIQI